MEENKYGFGLGKALKDAKPISEQKGIESLVAVQKDEGEILPVKDEKKIEKSPDKNNQSIDKKIVNVDRNQVYLTFRDKEGKEYHDSIINNNVSKKKKIEKN